MEWIPVEQEHFAEITHLENTYVWESVYDDPFFAAVETNEGWDIEKVILIDEIGLRISSDGDDHPYGWEITDVTHWMKIEPPKQ